MCKPEHSASYGKTVKLKEVCLGEVAGDNWPPEGVEYPATTFIVTWITIRPSRRKTEEPA